MNASLWGDDPASAPSNRLQTPLPQQFDAVPPDWQDLTEPFRRSPCGQALIRRLEGRRQSGATIYPEDVFAALRLTRRRDVRVLILGQDPYHGPGQAHGLAFSVPRGVRIPPSLRNIFKELARDLQMPTPPSGDLSAWAEQGVLLLNTCLTVEEGQAGGHADWGWSGLTDAIVSALASDPAPKVFMLWGAHAQRKRPLVEAGGAPHLLLQSHHPSPLSASRPPTPFVGNGHFSAAQAFLARHGATINFKKLCT